METYLWKINKEKLNKTNLALYSNFIKKIIKLIQVMILIKFGNGQLIIQNFLEINLGFYKSKR